MNERVKRLVEEAKKLTPEEQVELLDELCVSLHDHDAEIDKAWAAEIEKRVAAVERGDLELVDADVVLAELRARLGGK